MEHDNYLVEIDGEEKIIYPLLQVNASNKLFLIYTDIIKDSYDMNDLYVGEEKDGSIIPVPDNYIPQLEKFFLEIIKK